MPLGFLNDGLMAPTQPIVVLLRPSLACLGSLRAIQGISINCYVNPTLGVLIFWVNGESTPMVDDENAGTRNMATTVTQKTSNSIARLFMHQLNNQQFEGSDSLKTAGYCGPNAPP